LVRQATQKLINPNAQHCAQYHIFERFGEETKQKKEKKTDLGHASFSERQLDVACLTNLDCHIVGSRFTQVKDYFWAAKKTFFRHLFKS
jgi:hypothetical protein